MLHNFNFPSLTFTTKTSIDTFNLFEEYSEIFRWISNDIVMGGTLYIEGYFGLVSTVYNKFQTQGEVSIWTDGSWSTATDYYSDQYSIS